MTIGQRITVRHITRAKNANRRRHVFVLHQTQPDGRNYCWRLGAEEAFQLLDGLTDALDEYEKDVRHDR